LLHIKWVYKPTQTWIGRTIAKELSDKLKYDIEFNLARFQYLPLFLDEEEAYLEAIINGLNILALHELSHWATDCTIDCHKRNIPIWDKFLIYLLN
jgi:hypothetical protein